jgi:hypothetical protein
VDFALRILRLGLSLGCALVASTAYAAAGEIKHYKDGSVSYAGKAFPSLNAFSQSTTFRQEGLRCGTTAAMATMPKQAPADPKRQARVESCTNNLTTIEPANNPIAGRTFTIPVWFHVITNDSMTQGNLAQSAIDAQVAVLNEDFAGLGGVDTTIRFELVGVSRTANTLWFNTDNETLYKPDLAVDPSRFLNIYTKNFPDMTLGYAYLPPGMAGNELDGVVMLYSTIGGRDNCPTGSTNCLSAYDQGRTLVHEVGHYLGLYHTFETLGGSCLNTYSGGDLITDTPPQDVEDYGCTASSSCGVSSAIDNFMNYSDDDCMNRFTEEQANRMICSLTGYRPAAFTLLDENEEPVTTGLPIWLLYEASKPR